jgi:hypothetical protein
MRNATPGPSASGRTAGAHGAGDTHGGRVVQARSNVVKNKEGKDRDRDKEREKALKRPSSEEALDEEERERKKARFVGGVDEDFDEDDTINTRDNKDRRRKKRKKRKKPISVVASSHETSQRSEPEVMNLTLHASSETTMVNGSHGQATTRLLAFEEDRGNGVKVEDEAPMTKRPLIVYVSFVSLLFLSS